MGVQPIRRPGRFDLRLQVWYRLPDDGRWRRGSTHDVSATGALIQTSDACSAGEPIAIVIELPTAGCLVGRGRVVRALAAGASVTFAVAVDRFRLERRAAVSTSAAESSNGACPRGDLRVISHPSPPHYPF